MSARIACRACEGKGRHEVWAMSPTEPVRLFTCTVCHGAGRIKPEPMAPLSLVALRTRVERSPLPALLGALS
jgi:hypothetical protein